MDAGVLDKGSIMEHLDAPEPLVDCYLDLDVQLQANGFDLTVKEVLHLESAGEIGPGAGPASLPNPKVLPFGSDGYLDLIPGAHLITFNEIVNLPLHVMALGRPRSSLLRAGVAIHTAVWDAGYRGRSQALLVVYNHHGYRLGKDARLMQLVFFYLARPSKDGYRGRFFQENI